MRMLDDQLNLTTVDDTTNTYAANFTPLKTDYLFSFHYHIAHSLLVTGLGCCEEVLGIFLH